MDSKVRYCTYFLVYLDRNDEGWCRKGLEVGECWRDVLGFWRGCMGGL